MAKKDVVGAFGENLGNMLGDRKKEVKRKSEKKNLGEKRANKLGP